MVLAKAPVAPHRIIGMHRYRVGDKYPFRDAANRIEDPKTTAAVGAALSFIGLIHAPEVAWAANPEVALGYLFFGIVCVAYSVLPGAKDPVEVDESDIVVGH